MGSIRTHTQNNWRLCESEKSLSRALMVILDDWFTIFRLLIHDIKGLNSRGETEGHALAQRQDREETSYTVL